MRPSCARPIARPSAALAHLVREVFAAHLPQADLRVLYDVSHNTCKLETHRVDGRARELYVRRKGATRAWAPGHPELPPALRPHGQPVRIGGSMGSGSYVMAGTAQSPTRTWRPSSTQRTRLAWRARPRS